MKDTAIADGFNGIVVHLANHDVTLSAVSRGSMTPMTRRIAIRPAQQWLQ